MRSKIKSGILILFFGILAIAGCGPEKKDTRQWYKGNLHTHSYWSDGDEFPEMIMDWYKTHGYSFVALSDHNTLSDGEKWIKITKSKLYEDSFAKYLERFATWVTYKTDSGRTAVKLKPYHEYRAMFQDSNFLVIHSEEITAQLGKIPIHMNATNIQNFIPPQNGTTVREVMQATVDAVLAQRKETGVAMFPHINHPNFFFGITTQDIIDLHGERFFEVYNGHPMVHNYGDSLHPGTEDMWDKINLAYLKKKQPLLYGLATDDSHNYHEFGAAYSNAGRGWVMVLADSLNPGSLIEAMERGDFYSSTGVILDKISFENNTIIIKVKEQPGVTYSIAFVGIRKGDEQPRLLELVKGSEGNFELTTDYLFVRARISSDKLKSNPFQEGDYEMAWTQPVVR